MELSRLAGLGHAGDVSDKQSDVDQQATLIDRFFDDEEEVPSCFFDESDARSEDKGDEKSDDSSLGKYNDGSLWEEGSTNGENRQTAVSKGECGE